MSTFTDAEKSLWKEAVAARNFSYSPYSNFKVGAAFQSSSGVFTGCNVENVSYPAAICAERTALVKAVSSGVKKFSLLAIVAEAPKPVPPCGHCLQALAEFCSPEMDILLANPSGIQIKYKLKDLLPHSFVPEFLGVK